MATRCAPTTSTTTTTVSRVGCGRRLDGGGEARRVARRAGRVMSAKSATRLRVVAAVRRDDDADGDADGDAGEDDETITRVNAASEVLDKIIRETVEAIFVEEAATEVFNEVSETGERVTPAESVDKRAILRGVVRSHFEELDGSFLAALGAYVQASEASGDLQLVSLLNAIKEETLATVTDSWTDEMQVVQLVARLKTAEDRFEVMKTAHSGGGVALGDVKVPGVTVEKVERAAAQLVDEMELQEQVPNWELLYQVIVVRETARQLSKAVDENGVYSETVVSGSFAPSELPKAEAALIKELVVIGAMEERRAKLASLFDKVKESIDKSAQTAGPSGKIKLKATTRGFQPRSDKSSSGGLDVKDVRPGRLIDSIINLRVSLMAEGESSRAVVHRLGQLYFEACDVMMENANVG
jgi:hypothetical protein